MESSTYWWKKNPNIQDNIKNIIEYGLSGGDDAELIAGNILYILQRDYDLKPHEPG